VPCAPAAFLGSSLTRFDDIHDDKPMLRPCTDRLWSWRTSSSTSVCGSLALRTTAPSPSFPRMAHLTSCHIALARWECSTGKHMPILCCARLDFARQRDADCGAPRVLYFEVTFCYLLMAVLLVLNRHAPVNRCASCWYYCESMLLSVCFHDV